MKIKNKLYLITYTSNDQWEMSKGIMIVSAKNKVEARKLAKEKIGGQEISTILLIKPTRAKILFNKEVVIE